MGPIIRSGTVRPTRLSGQAFVETIVLMPFFLALLFLLLQAGHLGIAMAMVHYGASSAARQAVIDNKVYAQPDVEQQFKSLLGAGVTSISCKTTFESDPVTPNVTVTACAELFAYPFVGQLLSNSITSNTGTSDCAGAAKVIGPVAITASSPYKFIIESKAIARMNYNPGH